MENRDTFLTRLHTPPGSVVLSEEDVARIELAYDLAKYAHRAQDRKDGTRYFEHPRKVALQLIDGIALYDRSAIIAALLHDGFEDCPKYVTPMKVQIIGGDESSRMIRLLSKVPKEGYAKRLEEQADWKTLLVKLCDRYDNYSDLNGTPIEFQRRQTIETRDVYLPLFERLASIAPEPYKPRVVCMLAKLDWMVRKRAETLALDTPPAPQG